MTPTTATAAALFAAVTMAGCSLLVSLDGFAGSFEDSDAPSGADGSGDGSSKLDGSSETDATGDGGNGDGDAGGDSSFDVLACDAPGLVAYYKFDEGSGSLAANCVSGGSYGGTITGATWAPPIEGLAALGFDGTDRVDLASSVPLWEHATMRSFSVTASVIATVQTRNNLGRIVSKCRAVTAGCSDGLELLVEDLPDGGTPSLALRVPTVGTYSETIRDSVPFPIDTVVRVAGVYDSTGTPSGRVYRDGAMVGAGTLGSRRNTDGPVVIGAKADVSGGNRFVGRIDEIRIWNRVLTDCEIRTLAGTSCL